MKRRGARGPAQELADNIEYLLKCERLLDTVWGHLEPYDKRIPREVMRELHDHFGFDDSE